MLRQAKDFKGLEIQAKDGILGKVDELYFDDETWAIRYLTVETGGRLGGRQVLISPFSVLSTDFEDKRLKVALTKEQVENSPGINTDLPVSRQHETEFLGYYGYPLYWAGPYLWGPGLEPMRPASPGLPAAAMAEVPEAQPSDIHLRSTGAVHGYHIEATDGEIGHVDGFLVDDEAWAIRYVEVATRNWWPGNRVLVSPTWVEGVSWIESKVCVGLSRDAIRNAPEYTPTTVVTREYENRLHLHYGRPPYWIEDEQRRRSLTSSKF